ncbi:exportin-1-like [Aulostomus maculatus]
MATLEQHPFTKLLDFSQHFDINLLDNVIDAMYHHTGVLQQVAQEVLTNLVDHPHAWTQVNVILERSMYLETKYYALQILEKFITSRWKSLDRNQCEIIKKFIVCLVIKTSCDPARMKREGVFLSKLNLILVQVLKQEWPKHWPTFITDIVGASRTSESLCQNNMTILKLLSEEVFDFSAGQMTQEKAKHLKDSLSAEFPQILQLCLFVLSNTQNAPLVCSTLETLLRLLSWNLGRQHAILHDIFHSNLISSLVEFINVAMLRNVALKCLTEIAGVSASKYEEQFILLFKLTADQLKKILPLNTNIQVAYAKAKDDEQSFIHNLSLFLSAFLKRHGQLLEKRPNLGEMFREAHSYMLLLSAVEETEIFKICLDYWSHLVALELYKDNRFSNSSALKRPCRQERKKLYQDVLSQVRVLMVSCMAKPEDVLVVENDHGQLVREQMHGTDATTIYKTMRDTLVNLAQLDSADTAQVMIHRLVNQVNGAEWSQRNLNVLCWAIGSISGVMKKDDETRVLHTVVSGLLNLYEQKNGKDQLNVASNVMYIVGQYVNFMKDHWNFLKAVITKLVEFMHLTHDGVQDMACDTFFKIAKECPGHFVRVQVGEEAPFINEILNTISTVICHLQPQQVYTFFEAVGFLIRAQKDRDVQVHLMERYLALPNQAWDRIILQATKDTNILTEEETLRQLSSILRINISACRAVGHPFVVQLGRMYLNMLNIYKGLSQTVSLAFQNHGEMVAKHPLIRSMITVKRDILQLISGWVSCSQEPHMAAENIMPSLLDAVLLDYKQNVPAAREPEVLRTMEVIVNKLGVHMTNNINRIFDAVFYCTLDMIGKNFEEFPEHRVHVFSLLHAAVSQCFPAFLYFSPEHFKQVLHAIIWAFRHTERTIEDRGLQILYTVLQKVAAEEVVSQIFYQSYFFEVLQHILAVVTDTSHTAGLTMHATILAYMLAQVERGKVNVSLSATIPANNLVYVQVYIASLLKTVFPYLLDVQLQVFVTGLFSLNQNIPALEEHLRDFLVQIKEITGEDTSDLFLQEREAALLQAQQKKRNL